MSIFATSHGKQPCGRIDGTVNQQIVSNATKHYLKDQILSPSDMFKFYKGNIQNITFKFISMADVDNTRVILKKKIEGAQQIPGRRSFHEFSPIDQHSTEMKRTSKDKEPSYVHNFKNQTKQNSVVQVLDYVRLCDYVTNADKEDIYVQVKFMQLSSPSRSFQWPHVNDICWFPNDVLHKIDIPTTSSRRFYSILENDWKLTEERFLSVKR